MLIAALWIAAGIGVLVWVLARWRRDHPMLERSGAVFIPVPPSRCAEEIVRVLGDWAGARSVDCFPDDGAVEVRTHASMGSFGERVAVRTTEARGGSMVTVSSRPVSWAVVVDYGRNRRTVRAVLHVILTRCGGQLVERTPGAR